MKAIILILFLIIFLPISGFSQTPNLPPKTIRTLFIVKDNSSSKDILTKYLIISPSGIQKLDLLKSAEIKHRFGLDLADIVMEITPKPSVKLIRLPEFYDLHNIKNASRAFPIKLDGESVKDTTKFLIEDLEVRSVEVNGDSINISTKAGYRRLLRTNVANGKAPISIH